MSSSATSPKTLGRFTELVAAVIGVIAVIVAQYNNRVSASHRIDSVYTP